MKQLVFNITYRLSLLRAFAVYTFQQETAYWGNNWANILSTSFYTLSMVLFIDILYSNVSTVAGYNKDQMLLFIYIGQLAYYSSWLIHSNLRDLIDSVNRGNLDILLTKPVPALFYITFKRISFYNSARDGLPPMLLLTIIINWSSLNLSFINIIVGIIVAFLGVVIAHVMHFLFTVPVFWLGESTNLQGLSEHLEYDVGKTIPYEGFSSSAKVILMTAVPILISSGLSSSIVLGKSSTRMLLPVIAIAAAALLLRSKVWNIALKSYSSASS